LDLGDEGSAHMRLEVTTAVVRHLEPNFAPAAPAFGAQLLHLRLYDQLIIGNGTRTWISLALLANGSFDEYCFCFIRHA